YGLAPNANGSATVTVSVMDSGGTDNGGDDTSPDQTFGIHVAAVNDEPTVSVDVGLVTVNEGTSATNAGSFNDIDTGDLVAISASVGSITFQDIGNSGTWAWQFDSTDGPAQSQLVTVTADDGHGGVTHATFQLDVQNVAPVATFSNDGPVDEGSSFNLSLSAPFDPSVADTTAGFEYAFDCDDGSGLSAFSTTNTAVCTTDDDAVRAVVGQIRDKDGGVTEYESDVVVNNVPPTIESLAGPSEPVDINAQPVSIELAFSDPGSADTHDVTIDWNNDGTPDETLNNVTSPVSIPHSYAEPGVYEVNAMVTDDDGGVASAIYQFIVIYDPAGGFVTGGGWIDSPAGACSFESCDADTTGKANFGFVSKYKNGATVPSGETEFQFKAGGLNLHSTSHDWLVIAGSKAMYKGDATVNGVPGYSFQINAIDGNLQGGDGVDKFRIKIKEAGGGVIYDNQVGCADQGDNADPCTSIGGGNIKIHKANQAAAAMAVFQAGDFNFDGLVTFEDYLAVADNFGTTDASESRYDIDRNGTVDFADFLLLLRTHRDQSHAVDMNLNAIAVDAIFGERIYATTHEEQSVTSPKAVLLGAYREIGR
ncbi:MAG: hypothetical protein KDB27_09960, partial [Planctomycetales bacterium]|nr:hypothetical protein [Planctomycetales bacterium]